MAAWPPVLPDLKDDVSIESADVEDDAKLQRRLDASVSFVQRARKDAFETDDEGTVIEPAVFSAKGERQSDAIVMGTLMLAARLFARRRSPEAVMWLAQSVPTRLPWVDEDINRLLKLHRPRVG